MIHLHLDPTPAPAGEIVALTPQASVISLGEVRVGRRRFQARRTVDVERGPVHHYLLDSRGRVYFLDAPTPDGTRFAVSRDTGNAITTAGRPARFRVDGYQLSVVSD